MTRSEARYEKRVLVVDAVTNGESIATVCRVFGVPERTVFEWLSRYRTGGYDALREKKRSGRPRKVSGPVMRWLYNAITLGDPRQYQLEFCLWTLGIVRELLRKEHGIDLSKSGVSRLLHHLGLSPQRPMFRSCKQDQKKMERYLKKQFPQIRALARRTGAVIFFVDESAVRSDAHRGTTWGKIGATPIVENSGSRFGVNLISAVSPRGDMYWECYSDRMNGDRFVEFLRRLQTDARGPIIVIADNASYHRGRVVKLFLKEMQDEVSIHYLPPYAPELNPDEQVWNHAKRELGRLFIATAKDLVLAVKRILRDIRRRRELVTSFFQLKGTAYAIDAC